MDSDTRIAEDLRIHVADDRDGNGVDNYRYYPYIRHKCPTPEPDPTPKPTPAPHPIDGPVEIRGEVVNLTGAQTEDILWSASNFAAFWYDPDDDLMTETLTIAAGALSEYDRTINEGEIEYVAEMREVTFDYSGWGAYDAMSFMAETYFAGYNTNTDSDITDETTSLVSNKMLSKVLIDEDDKYTISTGASLELAEGYELKIIQLDINGDKAQIELLQNGKSVDTGIIDNTPATYVYTRDIGKADDVPLIAIRVDSVFAGTETDMIVIDGIFQISGDYISVKPGDNYGEMEIVNTSSDTIWMENYDDITLSEGATIDLMGDIRLVVADNETLRFAPVSELTEPGTYEVRGAVRRQDGNQSTAIVWNASNFAAFWYDLDSDTSTETLEIVPGTLSGLNRTIGEGNLSYTTRPVYREYVLYENTELTVDGHEGYLTEGWVGRQCVAINDRADKLCELLVEFEGDDKKTLATGEAWAIGGGFALTARQIDLEGDKVWFSLYKNGKEIDSEVTSSGGVYAYTPDIGGEGDVPVFTCYVTAVFRGTDSHIVQVQYVFLIDDRVLEIGIGDRFGCMGVVATGSDGTVLKNDEAIDLGAGTTRTIMEDMYFKTAHDSDIRFYPFVERTVPEQPAPPEEEPEELIPDSDGDGVPNLWDKEADTPQGYWVNSDGIGRRWGDMNGDGELTSADALMLLQAAAGKIGL
jgi:S-layer protein (TIGR01567 family)